MTDTAKPADWTKPAAMAIPKEGYFEPNRAATARSSRGRRRATASRSSRRSSRAARRRSARTARRSRRRSRASPDALRRAQAALPALGALRHRLGHCTSVPGHLRHRLRQVHRGRRRAVQRRPASPRSSTNLEGFPEDWKANPAAFIKFVREHQCPSFLEYGEYPYVTADEIKKALRLKAAFSDMLDQMQ